MSAHIGGLPLEEVVVGLAPAAAALMLVLRSALARAFGGRR